MGESSSFSFRRTRGNSCVNQVREVDDGKRDDTSFRFWVSTIIIKVLLIGLFGEFV